MKQFNAKKPPESIGACYSLTLSKCYDYFSFDVYLRKIKLRPFFKISMMGVQIEITSDWIYLNLTISILSNFSTSKFQYDPTD